MKTQVIGCPKTIDGDLKSKEVPISFGFDTACKVILMISLYIVMQAIKFLPYHTNRTVHSLILSLVYSLMIFPVINMQLYSEMIGNVMMDARSTGKYYHCKCSGCIRTNQLPDYVVLYMLFNSIKQVLKTCHGFARYTFS